MHTRLLKNKVLLDYLSLFTLSSLLKSSHKLIQSHFGVAHRPMSDKRTRWACGVGPWIIATSANYIHVMAFTLISIALRNKQRRPLGVRKHAFSCRYKCVANTVGGSHFY
jgi:hypothetical protein